jgi:recombination protein RecT
MQPTQQQSRLAPAQPTETEASRLLDQILNKAPSSRYRLINDALEKRIANVEEVLPDGMKGQAARLVKRAMMTFARKPELSECPPADFVRCVIEAAEIGLSIDGKLCYVVRYKNAWQMQPDYKGLIAVAKRSGQIKDCYADVVCEMDKFQHGREDGRSHISHTYALGAKRGEVIGAYAVVILPDERCRYEVMDRTELDRIQAIAPAQRGPWATHPNEMRKKTVIRRLLKLYGDDPGVIRCMELMDREFEEGGTSAINGPPTGRGRLADLKSEPAPNPSEADEPPGGGGALERTEEHLMHQAIAAQQRLPEPWPDRQPGDDDEPGLKDVLTSSIAREEQRNAIVAQVDEEIDGSRNVKSLESTKDFIWANKQQLGDAEFTRLAKKVDERIRSVEARKR